MFDFFFTKMQPHNVFLSTPSDWCIKSKSWSSAWSHVIWFVSREATPSPHPSPQLEACNLQSVPASSCPSSPPPSDPLLSSHVYHRDTSALESTEVRYLNDEPALEIAANQSHMTDSGGAKEESTLKAQFDLSMDGHESSPRPDPASCTVRRAESTSSTSPGSASQRLENLRRHQLDDKLEKLKERIRRQRQHLEESAEKEKDNQEQPIMAGARSNTGDVPTVRVRKVATAPPAPIYKGNVWVLFESFRCIKTNGVLSIPAKTILLSGFNRVETKIRTPDGKILKEDDFHHFTRKIYRDLSHQFAGKRWKLMLLLHVVTFQLLINAYIDM